MSYSSEEDDDFDPFFDVPFDAEANFLEVYGGVRKTWDTSKGQWHPYVAGGLSVINADAEVAVPGFGSASDDDTSLGGYLHGGAYYDVSENFFVGVDARALLGTDIELAGASGDADYLQFAVVLGFRLSKPSSRPNEMEVAPRKKETNLDRAWEEAKRETEGSP